MKLTGDVIPPLILGLFVASLLYLFWSNNNDRSESDGRSGLVVFTDSQTGCQYVGWKFHALTPRLDNNGKQICAKGTYL